MTDQITLIKKDATVVTPVPIRGDRTMGNLNQYRMSSVWRDTINGITKNGQMTLRCPFGLFDTKEPSLTNENTKHLYLIQVQMTGGRLFRYEITKSIEQDSEKGKHVTLLLTSYDIRMEEFLDSQQLQLVTPRDAFNQRIANFTTGRDLSSTGSIKLTMGPNDLPDTANQKQDWLPAGPTTTKQLLAEIIRSASSPQMIASSNEDWFYEVLPQSDTESFIVSVSRFGQEDSDITLDVETDGTKTQAQQIESYFDNTKYKNVIVIRGKKGAHSLPMDFARFASDMTHARIAAPWQIGQKFIPGDYTRIGNSRYKCKIGHTATPANVPGSSIHWENLTSSTKGSPWTLDTDLWISTMGGPISGYAGFFHDCNIVRRNYDRDDEFDEFEAVSVKDVEAFLTGPDEIPDGSIQHGRRWLVNNGIGTDWANHNNQIAQYDESVEPAVWRFSKPPVKGDIVTVRNGTVLRFDGKTWNTIWSLGINPEVSSPFFPVQSIRRIDDHTGTRKGIEFRFDWNVFDVGSIVQDILGLINHISPTGISLFGADTTKLVTNVVSELLSFLGISNDRKFIETFGIGNAKNKASRRYGFSIDFPFPWRGPKQGSKIKKSTIDFVNLHESMISGKRGWNQGNDTEDLGSIRGVEFWVKLLHENHAGEEIHGITNTKMVFWYRDLFDRIALVRFQIRAHNSWQKIRVPGGPDSNIQIWDSRIDELFRVWGYTFPFNHYIKERELTGVKFDWTKVRSMGCFNEDSYDENLLYTAGQNSYIGMITENILQTVKNLALYTGGIIALEKVVTDHVKFAISDLHFIKDAFVSTTNMAVKSPRMKMVDMSDQHDYVNIKSIGNRILSRRQFHPEQHSIYTRGNTRLVPGRRFRLLGQYSSDKQLVAETVEHIIDGTGYHCMISGLRKYEVT